MVLFPAMAVHMVMPYLGEKPRVTLSWDIKLQKSSKSAVPEIMTRPKANR